jgi:lysyl-tRNA synthetase class 2
MPSSVIREHYYDRQVRRLEITFVSGKVYVYEEVPLAIYLAFTAAFSKGTFFNKFIKDHYRYNEITRAAG